MFLASRRFLEAKRPVEYNWRMQPRTDVAAESYGYVVRFVDMLPATYRVCDFEQCFKSRLTSLFIIQISIPRKLHECSYIRSFGMVAAFNRVADCCNTCDCSSRIQ